MFRVKRAFAQTVRREQGDYYGFLKVGDLGNDGAEVGELVDTLFDGSLPCDVMVSNAVVAIVIV